ncbi:MAG: helix-turn-helix domain-containing protein [Deltaproteobacteria bacterium]
MNDLGGQTLYELLDVPPTATHLAIQRAYERARALYGPESLASYSLLEPDEAAAVSARLEEARRVLLDPDARSRYDARIRPEGEQERRSAREPLAQEPRTRPAPAADIQPAEGSPWTGALLRQVREARGLEIQQVSEKTKLTRQQIQNVEEGRLEELPPRPYLRGVVLSIAGALGLDGPEVARSYLEGVRPAPPGPGRACATAFPRTDRGPPRW